MATGRRVHRVELPEKDRRNAALAGRPRWLDDGRLLQCECITAIPGEHSVFWRFDLERGDSWRLEQPPPDAPDLTEEEPFLSVYNDPRRDREVWCSMSFGARTAFFTILQDRNVVRSWRSLPFELDESASYPYRRSGKLSGVEMHLVPSEDSIVWQTKEPPLAEAVPAAFRGWLPAFLHPNRTTHRTRLFNWKNNDWSDVGLGVFADSLQVRPDALFAIVETSPDKCFLQSWPLPPRDQKWPALGVAALATAATWWGCARSLGRRQRSKWVAA